MAEKRDHHAYLLYLRIGVGAFVSLLVVFWLTRQVNLKDVWELLQTASIPYVLLGLSSVALNLGAKVMRWRVFLGKHARSISGKVLLGVMLSGQLMNAIIPGRIGDVARILFVGRSAGKVYVLGTIALEKWMDTLAFILLFLASLLWFPLPAWIDSSSWGLVAVLMLVGSVGLFCAVYFADFLKRLIYAWIQQLSEGPRAWIWKRLEPGFASLIALKDGRSSFQAVFWTMIVWVTAILNNFLGMRALNVTLPFFVSIVLLLSLQLGVVSMASPAGVGVFEYICMLTLTYFGVNETLALSVGILLHVMVYFPLLLGVFSPFWKYPLPINNSNG
ncbi:MAG: hypothetical protein Fur0022_34860 [Anaerolineales bacterium]